MHFTMYPHVMDRYFEPFIRRPEGRYWNRMSLGARPIDQRGVEAIFDRKMADFQHKAERLVVRHVDPPVYFDAASDDPDLRFELETGYLASLEEDLRDPVLVRVEDNEVFTCPVLAVRVLTDEPAEIHRPFVEGAFLRKLFRFFVPATFEGGEPWEVTQQVREIMQRHFAFQLVACESVLSRSN